MFYITASIILLVAIIVGVFLSWHADKKISNDSD